MKYLLRRLLMMIPVLWAIYTITFLMVITMPGNPFQQPDRQMPEGVEQALEARYHIEDNWSYYWEYLAGALRLDFGPSFQYRDWTCTQIIAQSLPVSLVLGVTAIFVAVLVGVPVGVISAAKRNSWFDVGSLALVLIGVSLPTFVTGTALLLLFAVALQWLPVGGWGQFAQLPLPALTLSLPFMAYIARLTRLGMLDVLGSDYIRTAQAIRYSGGLMTIIPPDDGSGISQIQYELSGSTLIYRVTKSGVETTQNLVAPGDDVNINSFAITEETGQDWQGLDCTKSLALTVVFTMDGKDYPFTATARPRRNIVY
jgi:ABC-type microcin C transport system permease subunit YejB